MADSQIESLYIAEVADTAFVKVAVMLKNVGLTCHALPECIKHRLGDCTRPISDLVKCAVPSSDDLVAICALLESELRMGQEDLTAVRHFEGFAHGSRCLARDLG